ncbi:MAG: hypothetical protein QNI90_05880 [Dinoroseobacter sp.]|nr:hypothetical protein [Dinoroseobacter sp.]
MSILWTDEGRHMPCKDAAETDPLIDTVRTRRLAALEAIAQRRARGETEMIVRARRRHERRKQRIKSVK